MQITQIRLKNFRAFQDVVIKDIPRFMILVGANGTGKSTLFSVFGFLREAMNSNVTTALAKMGGGRGFREVVSRNQDKPIEIEIKFRAEVDKKAQAGKKTQKPYHRLVTYTLQIAEENNRPVVIKEVLKYRRGGKGLPWEFLNFSRGKGLAVTNELDEIKKATELKREEQNLKSPDLLAIKGLAQFKRFPAAVALGNLIERWHISDFHINEARPEQWAGYAEHLSRTGENLSLVVDWLYKNHRNIFNRIVEKLKDRVPGIAKVESKQTEEGRILLKFQDGAFEDPFLARYVSDGTIKMLAYLILLYDPKPHPLLCVEEPENQLYPQLLEELAEEFRNYADEGGQVFVSTHSPDFLNAAHLDEVFILKKESGYTTIHRASENKQIADYMMNQGDKMGRLWTEGLLFGEREK